MKQNTAPVENFTSPEQSLAHLQSLLHAGAEHRPAGGLRPQAGVGLLPASPIGPILVGVSAHGIAMIHFLRAPRDPAHALSALRRRFDPVPDSSAVSRVQDELDRFMAGDQSALRSKIDLSLVGGDFQRRVLERLLEVEPGAILTYSSLAAWVNAPHASRAVGGAMHDNPIPVYVPCHRVVRSDLSLGGYGGGLDLKRKLLEIEGFSFTTKKTVAQDAAVWGHRKTAIYCRPDCRALARANLANALLFRDETRAADAGMRACRLCAR
jgi:methylated-DNA-[protein]-cysteine S-methyltransferase